MDQLTSPQRDDSALDPRRYFEAASVEHGREATAPPVCLYLEVTNRCNLLCTTCPRTYVELEPPADMSWELFTRIVDQVPDVKRAVLHGVGEPMLVKNLPRMVRYLKDRGVYVLFNTNGTVLNERNGRALIDARLDELRVSLDAANAELYIKVRGKDYFNRILKNVKAFRALQEREGHAHPKVSAWLTGLKETVAELPAFVALAAEIGIKEVYLQRLVFFDRDTVGLARPDQALFEQLDRDETDYLARGGAHCAIARDCVQRIGRSLRAGHEPRAQARRQPVVAVPAAVVGHVFHRQRAGAAVLHRAVLPARLRELHARRCDSGDPARDLERPALPGRFAPRSCPTSRHRPAPTAGCVGACNMHLPGAEAIVSVVIPCLDEEAAIAGVVRDVLAQGVDEVVVVDNGSADATAARARAAGARVVSEPRAATAAPARRASPRCGPTPRSCASSTATAATCPEFLPDVVGPVARARPTSSWARACAGGAKQAA